MGGCLCCTGRKTILDTIENLLSRRTEFDHLIIECAGTTFPVPLVEALLSEKSWNLSICVVAVVDVFNWHRRWFKQQNNESKQLRTEIRQQLVCADLLLLNKIDLLSETELFQMKKEILEQLKLVSLSENSDCIVEETTNGNLNFTNVEKVHREFVVDFGKRKENIEIHLKESKSISKHQDVYEFGLFGHGNVNKQKLEHFLTELLTEKGDDLYRVKGVFNVSGKSFGLQAVHKTFELIELLNVEKQEISTNEKQESKQPILNRILFIGHPKALDFPGWKQIKQKLDLCFEGDHDLSYTL